MSLGYLWSKTTNLFGRPTLSGAVGVVAGTATGIAVAVAIPTTGTIATFALPFAAVAYNVTKRVVQFGMSQCLKSDKLNNCSSLQQSEYDSNAWTDIPPTQAARYPDTVLINTADLGNHMTCAWISSSLMNLAVGNVALAWNWQAIVIIGAGNLIAELASRTIRLKALSKFTAEKQFGLVAIGFGLTTLFSLLSASEPSAAIRTVYNLASGSPAALAVAIGLFRACKNSGDEQTGTSYTKMEANIECFNNCCTTVVVQSSTPY